MDIIKKIDIIIETTLTVDIEKNLAKGHVPVIGMRYKKKKRKNKLTGRDIIISEYEEENNEI
jgi:hypothetical protein